MKLKPFAMIVIAVVAMSCNDGRERWSLANDLQPTDQAIAEIEVFVKKSPRGQEYRVIPLLNENRSHFNDVGLLTYFVNCVDVHNDLEAKNIEIKVSMLASRAFDKIQNREIFLVGDGWNCAPNDIAIDSDAKNWEEIAFVTVDFVLPRGEVDSFFSNDTMTLLIDGVNREVVLGERLRYFLDKAAVNVGLDRKPLEMYIPLWFIR